jgi:hypothetical protein
MQVEAAGSFIMAKLEKELPTWLSYHNVEHTRNVLKNALEIAASERISGEDLDILSTAALLHDAGFIEKYTGHEQVSCTIAKQLLPQFDYSDRQIEKICEIIMATKIPQSPKDHLAEILCDADLYYLGTDDYGIVAEKLYPEFIKEGIADSKMEWQRQQIRFLESHTYFTDTAQELLSGKQKKNLILLQAKTDSPHTIKHHESRLSDVLLIIIGVIITSFALKSFLVPNNFFDGGITGISLLIHEVYHFNLAYVIVLVNIPFVIMSAYAINKGFAIKTFFCTRCLFIVHWIPIDDE